MRKPKFHVGDQVLVKDCAPSDYVGQAGMVVERGPGKAEYGVSFPNDQRAPVHYLRSEWLDQSTDRPKRK